MALFDKTKLNDTLFNMGKNIQKKSQELFQKAKDTNPLGPGIVEEDPNKYNNVVYIDKELEKHKKAMQEQQLIIDKLDEQLQEQIKARAN